jgi:putative transposon-encoded protein
MQEVEKLGQKQAVKVVGASGQISIGKRYAGKTVVMEQVEEGVWLLKIAKVIPESELWMHTEPEKTRIDKAISWAKGNPPEETDLEALSGRVS